MATQDLMIQGNTVDTSLDNVIIDKIIETVRGGRTLDVTGFAPTYIQAGHVILKNAAGEYVPQPVDGSIPVGAVAVGILTVSTLASKPQASIMSRGTVNENKLAYPINQATKDALGDRIAYALID